MGTIQLNISKKYDSMTVKEYTEELKKLSDQNIKIFEGKFKRGKFKRGKFKRGESGPYNLTMAYLLFDPLFFIVYYEGNEMTRLTTKTHTILENTIGIQVKDPSASTMLATVANYTLGHVREAAYKEEGITGDSCVADALKWALNNYVGPDKQEDYKNAVEEIFGEEMRNKMEQAINHTTLDLLKSAINHNAKQIVLTGAPGTGKTFAIEKYIEEKNPADHALVQFHSSYDYSDFVEGLRPAMVDIDGKKEMTFCRMDGIFKAFCRKAVTDLLKKILNKEEITPEAYKDAFLRYKNNAEEVQDTIKEWSGEKYIFAIDEINRADLSRVFGELMRSLEESYRGPKHAVATQYQNLPTYEVKPDASEKTATPIEFDCFADGFFIPENVYILGTMNDIDRSVETFDFALRRRFLWVEVRANEVMKSSLRGMLKLEDNQLEALVGRINEMNHIIADDSSLGIGFQIGPAYFINYTPDQEQQIWDDRIEPLLREYYRGRPQKDTEKFLEKCRDKLLKSADNEGRAE